MRRFPQLVGAEGEEGVDDHTDDAEVAEEQGALESGHVAEEDDGPPVACGDTFDPRRWDNWTEARKQNQTQ